MTTKYYSREPLRNMEPLRSYYITAEVGVILEYIKRHSIQPYNFLDLGTGTGINLDFFNKKLEGNFIGIDYDYEGLSYAINRYKNIKVIRGDASKLPFNKNTFDVVTCIGLFEMQNSFNDFIGEIVNVLKPNGILVFTAWNAEPKFNFKIFDRRLEGSGGYTFDNLKDELLARKMEIIECRTTFYTPRLLMMIFIKVIYLAHMENFLIPVINRINEKIFKTLYSKNNGMEWIVVARKI
jgi:ubiquinone/menaquinone biosynthesis C-methylase UbiE